MNADLSGKHRYESIQTSEMDREAGFAGFSPGNPHADCNDNTMQVLFMKLHELLLGRSDLIKISVEGMESEVLAGGERPTAKTGPFIHAE